MAVMSIDFSFEAIGVILKLVTDLIEWLGVAPPIPEMLNCCLAQRR